MAFYSCQIYYTIINPKCVSLYFYLLACTNFISTSICFTLVLLEISFYNVFLFLLYWQGSLRQFWIELTTASIFASFWLLKSRFWNIFPLCIMSAASYLCILINIFNPMKDEVCAYFKERKMSFSFVKQLY